MFAYIKSGFRERQALYITIIISVLLYAFLPPSYIKFGVLLAAVASSQIMMMFFVQRFTPILEDIFAKKKLEPIDIPELYTLAQKRGIKLPKQAFYTTYHKTYAYTNTITQKIVFGKKFFEKFTKDEILFIGGHELSHLDKNQIKQVLPLFIGFPIAIWIISQLNIPNILIWLASLATLLFIFNIISHKTELKADIGGAMNVKQEVAISAIKKVYEEKGLKTNSETHPSGEKRIKNLIKFYTKQNQK